jgi:hypothetical protein
MSRTIQTGFLSRNMLKVLSQRGLQTASLARWSQGSTKRKPCIERVRLQREILGPLENLIGPIASWAEIITSVDMDTGVIQVDLKTTPTSCEENLVTWPEGKPNGNSIIGFLDKGLGDQYTVGQVKGIYRIYSQGGIESTVVCLVQRYEAIDAGYFSPHLWLSQLAHPVLGMHLVSSQQEAKQVLVPIKNVIGHTALCPVRAPDGTAAHITIQLVKVSKLHLRRPYVCLTDPRTSTLGWLSLLEGCNCSHQHSQMIIFSRRRQTA